MKIPPYPPLVKGGWGDFHTNKIKLSPGVTDIPATIKVDERKLKQIVYNLLANAVKFTPDGGCVTLAACHRSSAPDPLPGEPVGQSRSPREWIEVSVKDTGIGINPEDLEALFDPFVQGKAPSGMASPGGTGLGLSLAKKMVELHVGRIWGESDGEGKGSTFRFTIPLSI